jgi:antitoxin component of MazEF toxin-antitoxin module
MAKMLNFGIRKASRKFNGYLVLALPSAYIKAFNITKGERFEILAQRDGSLILKRVK